MSLHYYLGLGFQCGYEEARRKTVVSLGSCNNNMYDVFGMNTVLVAGVRRSMNCRNNRDRQRVPKNRKPLCIINQNRNSGSMPRGYNKIAGIFSNRYPSGEEDHSAGY